MSGRRVIEEYLLDAIEGLLMSSTVASKNSEGRLLLSSALSVLRKALSVHRHRHHLEGEDEEEAKDSKNAIKV